MTAVVETFRKIAYLGGGIKMITIQTDATAATSATIDLHSDIADAKGQVVKEILNTILQDDVGTNVADCAFDQATGIITLPAITTGIHNVTIIAR